MHCRMMEVVSHVKIEQDMDDSFIFCNLLPKLSLPEKVSVGLAPGFYPRKNQLLVNLKQV